MGWYVLIVQFLRSYVYYFKKFMKLLLKLALNPYLIYKIQIKDVNKECSYAMVLIYSKEAFVFCYFFIFVYTITDVPIPSSSFTAPICLEDIK